MSGALASLNYMFRQAWKNRSRLVTPSALGQPSVLPPVFQKLCGAAQDDLAKAVGALGEGAMTTVIDILERHHPEQYSSGPGDKVPRRCLPHRKRYGSGSNHADWGREAQRIQYLLQQGLHLQQLQQQDRWQCGRHTANGQSARVKCCVAPRVPPPHSLVFAVASRATP